MECSDLLASRGTCLSVVTGREHGVVAGRLSPAVTLCVGLLACGPAWAQSPSRTMLEWSLLGLGAALLVALTAACAWLVLREQRANQRLRQVRLHLRALSDQLDVWQWRSSADHRITGLRPPAGAQTSRWSGPGVGASLWERFPALDVAALKARLEAHAPLVDVEIRFPQDEGEQRPGWLRATTLTDAEGRFAGYIGVVRETPSAILPAAHKAAPTARSAPPAPQTAVAAAAVMPPAPPTAPATAAAASAEPLPSAEPAQAPDESFMYTLSHDLRAPIRVVDGFARILKEDYGRQIDRIGNDHIDRVLSAAARMSSMIDALLGLSRLSAKALDREPVNLSQLAAYVADDLRRQSPAHQVDLHIEPEMVVQGDPTLLRMVIENLLGNAWKYTGKLDEATIWFGCEVQDGQTVYTVRDNGAGFDMRFADRLFSAFQRLHSATEFQGTGVGLVSVKRIVHRHGGHIWAKAEPGQGASFHFTLAPRGGNSRGFQ